MARPQLAFTYEKETFPIPVATLARWVSVTGTRAHLAVTIDPQRFGADIRKLAPGIEVQAKNGSLVIKDGKIDSFVAGTEGEAIDTDAMRDDLLTHWPASSTFPLIVITSRGTLLGEDPKRLGIRELLGVGTSNFAGSPTERRKNIAHGVRIVNGTIVQPGDTFSLVDLLGEVDGDHGWTPALVIKGNKTEPGFGGGLCQIGTTTFRGAMAAGLPIVERQNHSYRVHYYEPAGTDATIYGPHPDLKFLNDTEHAILINAYTKGDNAYFEFWGTKDGRKAEMTKPRIWNSTPPPPMKLIETLDLPLGKKNCTETAHEGADAEFTYNVTMPDGNVRTQVFKSHYRPWQAVCLVGVEKLTQPVDALETPLSADGPDAVKP
jgi:vancomycin resistance protein YoaR